MIVSYRKIFRGSKPMFREIEGGRKLGLIPSGLKLGGGGGGIGGAKLFSGGS